MWLLVSCHEGSTRRYRAFGFLVVYVGLQSPKSGGHFPETQKNPLLIIQYYTYLSLNLSESSYGEIPTIGWF